MHTHLPPYYCEYPTGWFTVIDRKLHGPMTKEEAYRVWANAV